MSQRFSSPRFIGIGSAWVNRFVRCAQNQGLSFGVSARKVETVGCAQYRSVCKNYIDAYQYAGGAVANTLVALSRLGYACGFMGRSGYDADGLFFRNDLCAHGVQVLIDPVDEGFSTSGCLSVYSNDSCVKYVHHGASKALQYTDVPLDMVMAAEYVLLEADTLDMPQAEQWVASILDIARKNTTTVVLVLSNKYVVARNRYRLLDLLPSIDILIGNQVEFETLFNSHRESDIVAAVEHLSLRGIMTCSEHGGLSFKGGALVRFNASSITAVDTTAAGDYFLAGYLYAMIVGLSEARALDLGAAAAAIICAERGSRCSDFSQLTSIAEFMTRGAVA